MRWSLIFVSALYHRLPLQNVGRFRLRQNYVCLLLSFSSFLTFTFGSSLSSALHSASRRQNLYDGVINVTLADVFYSPVFSNKSGESYFILRRETLFLMSRFAIA